MISFKQFLLNEESSDELLAKVRLTSKGKGQTFKSLSVNSESNPNLIPIIEAFENSGNVKVGYTTVEKKGGESQPTLKSKKLYLCGGSLRNHLNAETFKDYNLVTDATPSETKLILGQSDGNFTQIKPKKSNNAKYSNLPETSEGNVFYVSKWDAKNKELQITAEVNGQKIYISTLNTHSKYTFHVPTERNFTSSLLEDAKGRNFTCNALYLKLKTAEGENGELLDPLGGLHDLKNGIIKPIRDDFEFYVEEPENAFRCCSLSAKLSPGGSVSDDNAKLIEEAREHINPKKTFAELFKNAINDEKVPTDSYIKNLNKFNLLELVFPSLKIDQANLILPNNASAVTAYILKNNNIMKVAKVLKEMGWKNKDIVDVLYFVKLYDWTKTNDHNLVHNLIDVPTDLDLATVAKFLKPFGKSEEFMKILKNRSGYLN